MGCCLSTTTNETSKPNPDVVVNPNHHHHCHFPESDSHGGAPPQPPTPPPLEEETVKEVLSETAIPKPPTPTPTPILNNNNNNHLHHPVVEEVEIQSTALTKPSEEIVSEVSDFSEMCSFSESLSTTLTEKRDDDGEVTQRVQRSPAKIPQKRPKIEKGFRSPARRSEPSPVKRTHIASTASTSVQGRKMTSAGRNVGAPNGIRRDPGRRSRSPVTRGEAGIHRPVRYRSPNLNGRMPEETAESGGGRKKRGGDASPETKESLENPLVSLECFIFL
ncbi:hypothetical protein LOK49_LG06G01662 [Camellia lanceoleosa]|uniref:Uncharacterized protein n=1 Tax=Camellia lanceoleosa TaxID=1840588 RepID=A0ACC0HCK6_9ERIC|nr:hypothetical protein LOK49_LG06G01662 [Camellia lanceoleosa]